MSILNRASDGSAPVLLVLWRALRVLGPMPRDRLLALCAPECIGNERARQTLTRWTQIGLFEGDESKVMLRSPFNKLQAEGDPLFRALRRELRHLVLHPDSNKDFLKPNPGGAADFTFVVAWLLSVDVYADHFSNHEAIQRFERDQVEPIGEAGDKYAFQNSTRWDGFQDWAPFLGLSSYGASLQLDPSEAVEDELDNVFAESGELRIDDFIWRLASVLPVVDEGKYATSARDRGLTAWRPMQPAEVSPALSRALLALSQAGALKLEHRSDADSRKLLGHTFRELSRVTHVVRTAGAT